MDLQNVLEQIKSKLNNPSKPKKVKVVNLFAYNTSGKTRLSKIFQETEEEKVLCYNAFLEDFFYWDNENYIFKIDQNSWLLNLINTEGLYPKIIDNFKKLTNTKLEPFFDILAGEITFKYYTGNAGVLETRNIKISKGEESLFIWSVFYTILDLMVETLLDKEEDRSTTFFNKIEYIVIDDPVSSIDDTRIITLTLELIDLIKKSASLEKKIKFLITTHHNLFFNILYNESIKEITSIGYIMSKLDNNDLCLEEQKTDSPFSYHHLILKEIKKAIKDNNIQKYHFNLFRALLEKTSNFLGYTKWDSLLDENKNKKIFIKQLNHYSHSSLSEIEAKHLQEEEKEAFKIIFNSFIIKFHWSNKNAE